MTERERLIELIEAYPCMSTAEDCFMESISADLADSLLANGVIVPPCKVGQTVWFIRNKTEIIATAVKKIILKHGGLYIKLCCNSMYETTCNSIGKTVFLSREEAEEALERSKG